MVSQTEPAPAGVTITAGLDQVLIDLPRTPHPLYDALYAAFVIAGLTGFVFLSTIPANAYIHLFWPMLLPLVGTVVGLAVGTWVGRRILRPLEAWKPAQIALAGPRLIVRHGSSRRSVLLADIQAVITDDEETQVVDRSGRRMTLAPRQPALIQTWLARWIRVEVDRREEGSPRDVPTQLRDLRRPEKN